MARSEASAGDGRTGDLRPHRLLGRAGRGGGDAYKNIDEVIEATELAGITRRVVRFTPIGNVKG